MDGADEPLSLAWKAIDNLDVPEPIKTTLRLLQAQLTLAYQRNFVSLSTTIERQASALDRLQTTLQLLIEKIAPELKDRIPVPIRVVEDLANADVAAPLIQADPMGAGYTLTQTRLADALGLPPPVVSVLVRCLKLNHDEKCAVAVRRGREADTFSYHPRAIARFKQLVEAPPPSKLSQAEASALKRARRMLGLTDGAPARR